MRWLMCVRMHIEPSHRGGQRDGRTSFGGCRKEAANAGLSHNREGENEKWRDSEGERSSTAHVECLIARGEQMPSAERERWVRAREEAAWSTEELSAQGKTPIFRSLGCVFM